MPVDVESRTDHRSDREAPTPLLAVWTDRQAIGMVAGVVVIYLVIGVIDDVIATIGLPTNLTTGAVIVLGLLLGPIAAWGVAIGSVLNDIAVGGFALDTGVGFLGQFILAALAFRLWGSFGFVSATQPAGNRSLGDLLEYGLVAITATSLVEAISAWAYLIAGVSTFPATVVNTLPGHLLSALVVGPVILYSVSGFVDRHRIRFHGTTVESTLDKPTRHGALLVLFASLGWAISGVVIGIIGQAIELDYPHLLVNRLGRWILPFLDFLGPGGIFLQLFVGFVAIGVCLWGVTRV